MPVDPWIELASGRPLDLTDPQPDRISIDDVASQISKLCRFSGACTRLYSVGEHSLLVSECVRRLGGSVAEQMGGLLHDAAEAVTNDIARPVKGVICGPGMRRLTGQLDDIMVRKYGAEFSPRVKEADNLLCRSEAEVIMPSRGRLWEGWPAPLPWVVVAMQDRQANDVAYWENWRNVRLEFLHHFWVLEGHLRRGT